MGCQNHLNLIAEWVLHVSAPVKFILAESPKTGRKCKSLRHPVNYCKYQLSKYLVVKTIRLL